MIKKFSDEAMREAGPCFELGNWDAGKRILLADVNAQIAAQTPAIAPEVSETLQWAANTIERLCDCEADRGDTQKCLAAIHKVQSELPPQSATLAERDGRNSPASQEVKALRPLTYDEACALKPGDKVVCLDVGKFADTFGLVVGKQYPVISFYRIMADKEFCLNKDDCHLFAALPSAEQSPPAGSQGHGAVSREDAGYETASPAGGRPAADAILRLNVMRAKGFDYYVHDANPSVPLANATVVDRITVDVPIRVVAKGEGRNG